MEYFIVIVVVLAIAYGIYKISTKDNDDGGSGGGGRSSGRDQNRY